jgi:hypothetical protein
MHSAIENDRNSEKGNDEMTTSRILNDLRDELTIAQRDLEVAEQRLILARHTTAQLRDIWLGLMRGDGDLESPETARAGRAFYDADIEELDRYEEWRTARAQVHWLATEIDERTLTAARS